MQKNIKLKHGFTIVELLIVIVVIGILAAITVVAYNGIQSRANDTKIRSAVSQIEKATQLWVVDHGKPPVGGWSSTAKNSDGTCTGGTGGWASKGHYACSLEDMLLYDQFVPPNLFATLPANKLFGGSNSGAMTTMFYPCGGAASQTYALYYYLANPTAQDAQDISAVESKGCPSSPRVTYGMRGAKLLTF